MESIPIDRVLSFAAYKWLFIATRNKMTVPSPNSAGLLVRVASGAKRTPLGHSFTEEKQEQSSLSQASTIIGKIIGFLKQKVFFIRRPRRRKG